MIILAREGRRQGQALLGHDPAQAVRIKISDLALPLPGLGGRLELGDLAFTLADAAPGAPPGPLEGDRRYRVS